MRVTSLNIGALPSKPTLNGISTPAISSRGLLGRVKSTLKCSSKEPKFIANKILARPILEYTSVV